MLQVESRANKGDVRYVSTLHTVYGHIQGVRTIEFVGPQGGVVCRLELNREGALQLQEAVLKAFDTPPSAE